MTTRAAVRSGRRLAAVLFDTNVAAVGAAARETSSMGQGGDPEAAAFSNAVARTVSSAGVEPEVTVASALPAYIGRTNVLSSTILSTSVMGETSMAAAIRGAQSFISLQEGARMCVKPWSLINCATAAALGRSVSDRRTRDTPESVAASVAAAADAVTSKVHPLDSCCAAEMVASDAAVSAPPSCAASTSVDAHRAAERKVKAPRENMPATSETMRMEQA
mmetsp:Transcript_3562/g.10814  ORF Transcript_3562/g.10814 Transcript_3562/m.10814 type:complete len:220 (+) Transcript_3562:435-1094(+)